MFFFAKMPVGWKTIFPFWNGPFSGDIRIPSVAVGHPQAPRPPTSPPKLTVQVGRAAVGVILLRQDARSKVQVFNRFEGTKKKPKYQRHLGLRTTMISYCEEILDHEIMKSNPYYSNWTLYTHPPNFKTGGSTWGVLLQNFLIIGANFARTQKSYPLAKGGLWLGGVINPPLTLVGKLVVYI